MKYAYLFSLLMPTAYETVFQGINLPGNAHAAVHPFKADKDTTIRKENIGFPVAEINANPKLPVKLITHTQHISTSITANFINSVTTNDKKVSISDGENGIEFSPFSTFNSGAMIEPVNTTTSKGLPTAFYLRDTSSWSFYTDAKLRLAINGNGSISTTAPLLINNAAPDGSSSLRVNGSARFDSTLWIKGPSDDNAFISLTRTVRSAQSEPDDRISPYTTTPVSWAMGNNIPTFRLRHPNNIVDEPGVNTSVQRDFLILPYQYGMAIEYNGVVECWVGEWSIHKGLHYHDAEGKGNGWGGVLWVGTDIDDGGVRATARNNIPLGGNVNYGELSVEKFAGESNGDFRFRLPSTSNQFQFVYGERGSENIIARVSSQGLTIPTASSATAVRAPEKAQILFDSTDNTFKGFTGSEWITLAGSELKTGTYSTSANGSDLIFVIPHGLATIPSYFNVIATSQRAANVSYVTATSNHLVIYYNTPPLAGINNLSWNWQVKR